MLNEVHNRKCILMRALTCFLLIFALLVLPVTAYANVLDLTNSSGQKPQATVTTTDSTYIVDGAGLLTSSEAQTLEAQAKEIADQYACGLYIYTSNGTTSFTAAEDLYEREGLGYGDGKEGVLLVLGMAERDYAIVAYGGANDAFTEYAMDYLEEEVVSELKNNDWYGAFSTYLSTGSYALQMAADGKPLTWQSNPAVRALGLLISIILGLMIAGGVLYSFEKKMRSVYTGDTADQYVTQHGVKVDVRQDKFLHRTTTRTKIESKSSGGSRSTNSRGFSGRSGKF